MKKADLNIITMCVFVYDMVYGMCVILVWVMMMMFDRPQNGTLERDNQKSLKICYFYDYDDDDDDDDDGHTNNNKHHHYSCL